MKPMNEKRFSQVLRAAFLVDDSVSVAPQYDDDAEHGDSVALSTTLVEGADQAILSIKCGDVALAMCLVTRQDLLKLKKDFDMFAKLKAGKSVMSKSQYRKAKRVLRKELIGQIDALDMGAPNC